MNENYVLRLVNRLTNKTLKKLISCLYYQNYVLLNDSSRGLLYVFLEVIFIYYSLKNVTREKTFDVWSAFLWLG